MFLVSHVFINLSKFHSLELNMYFFMQKNDVYQVGELEFLKIRRDMKK